MNLPSVQSFFAKFDKRQWLIVFLVTLLAFAIRAHLMRYELFFEFDSYLHARIIGYVLQTGSVPAVDPLAYYFTQVGMPVTYVFWYLSAFIYKILFLGAAYSKANVILLVKFLPAFYGALISGAMFFLGKEIYSKKAGYAMAFIAAVSPAFVYRTMSGFFEDDCLGFLWFVLGLIFFVRAMKSSSFDKKMALNVLLSGIFFGTMIWSWGMFLLIPIIIIPFFVLALLRIGWIKTKNETIVFAGAFAAIMVIFYLIGLPLGMDWIMRSFSYADQALGVLLWPLIIGAVAVLFAFFYLVFSSKGNAEKTERYAKFSSLFLVMILFGVLLMTAMLFVTKDRIFEVSGVLGASVGEENTGHQFFAGKYNALIILPVLALILLPLRIWREKKDYFSLLLFVWILVTLVMAWYKLKFTFVFGLSIAPAAGIVAEELFFYIKKLSKLETKIVFACFAFILLTGLAAGITFTKTNIPNIEYSMPDWKPALEWMRTSTPADAKMFNWWNQGHWITFMGERAVLNDNRNMSKESDRDFAIFAITPDLNTALELVAGYKSDYVVLDATDFGSAVSMAEYAFDTINTEDPRILPYRMGPSYAQPCSVSADGTVSCGGNNFPAGTWQSIPSTWQSTPNQLYQERVPLFLYRDSSAYIFYVMNEATNNSIPARLWFNEAEAMKFFEQSYSGQGIKIFKINKEAIREELQKA